MRHSWLGANDFDARDIAARTRSATQMRDSYGEEWPGGVEPSVPVLPDDPFDPSKYWAYFSETD